MARPQARRARPINGWLVLDKPLGMTSTQASTRARLTTARRWAMAARSIRWRPACCRSPWARRPRPCLRHGRPQGLPLHPPLRRGARDRRRARARSPRPASAAERTRRSARRSPGSSARSSRCRRPSRRVKVEGERAYDLARARRDGRAGAAHGQDRRAGAARRVPTPDHADFVVACGKGAYVRALARDLALSARHRRPRVGAAAHRRRPVPRGSGHFASQTGGPRAYSAASRGSGSGRDRAGRHPGAGRDGTPGAPAARRPAGARRPGTYRRPARWFAPMQAGELVALARFDGVALQPVRVFNL